MNEMFGHIQYKFKIGNGFSPIDPLIKINVARKHVVLEEGLTRN